MFVFDWSNDSTEQWGKQWSELVKFGDNKSYISRGNWAPPYLTPPQKTHTKKPDVSLTKLKTMCWCLYKVTTTTKKSICSQKIFNWHTILFCWYFTERKLYTLKSNSREDQNTKVKSNWLIIYNKGQ